MPHDHIKDPVLVDKLSKVLQYSTDGGNTYHPATEIEGPHRGAEDDKGLSFTTFVQTVEKDGGWQKREIFCPTGMLAGRLILRARNVQARREELRAGRAAEGTGWSWIPEGKAMMGDDKAYSTRNAQHCMNAIDRGINFTTRFHAWSQTYQSQRSLQEWTDRIEIPDGDPIILKATHTPAHGEFLGSFNLRNNANEMVTIPYNACPGYQWLSFDDELPRCGRMPSVDYLMEGVNAFEWTAYSEDDQVRLQDFFTATLRHWTSRTWKTEEDEASRTHLSLGASGTVSLEATIDPSIRPDSLRPLWVGGRAT